MIVKNFNKFRYPFIDILIFKNYKDSQYQDSKFPGYIFSRRQLFPLIKRYFNGLMLYSPCNMEYIFQELFYNVSQCVSSHMDHYRDIILTTKYVSCESLKEYYPFVDRYQEKKENNIVMIEKLKIGNKTIHTIQYSVPNKCTDEFSLYPSDLMVL